ncbi:succinyldiaminopimelate transaminase [Aquiluna sp. KACHI24]|uniref:succinyldiaminopimelate transaminase n=1 Tax=Aquiluna sp. KACHI24 TaxID=2968831 RepID=UPI00220AF4AF|nr:succinyldiaminopimelate transaminase [Aquiluna sp. KACHI24]BDQ00533.1 succinyldiaminopimelate transaminase [Aquiluna sp. KACHI24]
MFDRLSEYPWQRLKPYRELASQHPEGSIDLSVGNPVDPTPKVIQNALDGASDSPGYPTTWGEHLARQSVCVWYATRRRSPGLSPEQVLLTIGSKEFISWLPLMLGLGPGDLVVQPTYAYTAYEVGAKFCGADVFVGDEPSEWPENTKLIWLNSPGNPSGEVLSVERLRKALTRARELGAVIVNDECYAELGWGGDYETYIPCMLDPEVTDGNLDNVLSIYSLSKQSNLAGYRAAFAAGDEKLIKGLVNLRMHSGMMVPMPVQKAIAAALGDHEHVAKQKDIYRRRRDILLPAVRAFGFEISNSEAGLYLWATRGNDCWQDIQELAELGIVAVPGEFYGEAGKKFVRFSITATDDEIQRAAERLLNALG